MLPVTVVPQLGGFGSVLDALGLVKELGMGGQAHHGHCRHHEAKEPAHLPSKS
jgi:hypothetical protein